MEILIGTEQAFHLMPIFSVEVAQDRLEQKKTNLVAGTVNALLSRPKPEDIKLLSLEYRLEPFWVISAFLHTSFDRNASYTIPVTSSLVHAVTIFGQDISTQTDSRGVTNFSITSVEHCLEERRTLFTFDGTGVRVDMNKYLSSVKNEISDWASFAPTGVLVVPPSIRATAVIRSVLSDMIKPVQAQIIHKENITLEKIDLNFRPVYAMEYEWAVKSKRVILEFDAITGDIHTGGKKLSDQMKNVVTRDLIFDVTADAVGMLVPGGSIAVKLVKAVVDRK